jgi:WD40-like Beta Propeller Repeat
MPPSSEEILSSSRAELARGRPRAALSEMERARVALSAAGDVGGLQELLGLARGVHTLAPVDTNARERLLVAVEWDIQSLSPGAVPQTVSKPENERPSTPPNVPFSPYARFSTEQIFAPVRSEIERHKTGRALRRLEKARRKLLARGDIEGFEELTKLAARLPLVKPRHRSAHDRLIYAARQNVGYLSRRTALKAGEEWHDLSASAGPKTSLPSLPPMTRREKLIAVAVAVALAGGITALALLDRAPQRVVHAIKCPTGEQGGPTWSPDGKEIAFAKNRECGTQITVISLENGRLRTVSNGYGVLPDWSPDGRAILYRSRDGFSVVPARGGESRLIRSDDGDMGASWSPDGERIAFVHGLDPYQNFGTESYYSTMYTMKPDGSDVRRLLGHSCNPRTPDWSPAGANLVFACDDGVYFMPWDGGPAENYYPRSFGESPISVSWSTHIDIAIGWDGVETADLVEKQPMTIATVANTTNVQIDVAWAPSGKQIAYSVVGSGADDGLYLIDRDGSHRRLLVKF